MSARHSGTLDHLALEAARRHVRLDLEDATPSAADRLGRQRLVVGIAAALFAAAFAARLAIHDPNALVANFYTVPIALLAIEFGLRTGLGAAAFAFVLVWAWGLIKTYEVGALGYVSRGAVFLLVGGLVGRFSERLRADIAARQRQQRELALYADELERSNARLARSVLRLEAFSEIARAVGGETDLRRVLQLILDHGREILGAGSLLVFLREGNELVLAAGTDLGAKAQPVPRGIAETLTAMSERQAVALASSELAALGIRAESAVLVPLIFHRQRLGVLAAIDRPADAIDADADLLQAVGASAATAVMTAKSVARERLRDSIEAAEQARGRWARELHDETLQGLGGLGMLLSSALAAGDDAVLRGAVSQAVEETAREIRTLRGLIAELRPAALDDIGLGAAIETLVERSAAASGLTVKTELSLGNGGAPLSSESESTAYRVVQEALTNVVKHAQADEVLVRLAERDGGIEILVRDDGRGFDPDQPRDGLGLVGMQERVTLVGGRLRVSSKRGGPTTVEAVVPG